MDWDLLMNIIQIIPAFHPSKSYGGAPLVAYKMCKILAERGNKVTVFTTDANDSCSRLPLTSKKYDDLEIFYSKNMSNYVAYNYKIFLSPEMSGLLKSRISDSDVVHLHDYRTLQNVIAYKHVKKFAKPYVIQPHGAIPRSNGKRELKFIFDISIGDKILKNSSRLLVLNKSEMNRCITKVDQQKIQIIPNGIDLKNYSCLPEKGLFKKKYGINIENKLILYVGRIHSSKGIDFLIRVFAKITKKIERARLVIAGPDDGYLEVLKNLASNQRISDKIIFTGYLSHNDKLCAFIDSEAFVTPKFYGFPLTFLESMACGIPIITTDEGDYLDWINDRVGLVTNYSEQELEQAIIRILSDSDLGEEFGKNAQKDVQYFDWNQILNDVEYIYKSL